MFLLSGCANQQFKAEEPVDYKDNARYGFGSLIKDENSVLNKYFNKSNTSSNELAVEKVSANSPKDKLWNAAIVALKDFPIEFMDKKSGRVETGAAKVRLFDNTETCSYTVSVMLRGSSDVDVVVRSAEDSAARLKKHAERVKSKILAEYKR